MANQLFFYLFSSSYYCIGQDNVGKVSDSDSVLYAGGVREFTIVDWRCMNRHCNSNKTR